MASSGGTVGMTLAQIKTGQIKATLPGVRQMQLQQIPIAQQQQRKNAAAASSRFVLLGYCLYEPYPILTFIFLLLVPNHSPDRVVQLVQQMPLEQQKLHPWVVRN